MTLIFPNVTFTNSGLFNILQEGGETIGDQVQLVHAAGGDLIHFASEPSTPIGGTANLGTATEGSGVGAVATISLGNGLAAVVGSDSESAFNPLDIAGVSDTSDFVSIVPEPSTIGLLGPSLVGLMMVMYRSKKRAAL